MKIRLSTSRQLITLVVGMAIMLAISLPKCIADNESADLRQTCEQIQKLLLDFAETLKDQKTGENTQSADLIKIHGQVQKLLSDYRNQLKNQATGENYTTDFDKKVVVFCQSLNDHPATTQNDRDNADPYSYGIGYMCTCPPKGTNKPTNAFRQWLNYQNEIFKKLDIGRYLGNANSWTNGIESGLIWGEPQNDHYSMRLYIRE